MISVSNRTFALPLTSVSEIFYLELDSMRNVDGLNTIVIRDKAIPLFFLKQWFENVSIKEYLDHKANIVLVQVSAAQLVGFVVDELLGQEEVVIKPLDDILRHTPGMAGATITSDGGIALILDIPGLMRAYAHKNAERVPLRHEHEHAEAKAEAKTEASQVESLELKTDGSDGAETAVDYAPSEE
jgi:two-component system chemotaxis sensor kinase CheA